MDLFLLWLTLAALNALYVVLTDTGGYFERAALMGFPLLIHYLLSGAH